MPQCALAYAAAGAVNAARGLPGEGRTELQHAVRCRRAVPKISPWATLEATLLLVGVELDLGDAAAAAELISKANDVLTLFPDGTSFQQARLARLRSANWPFCSCSRARCPCARSPRNSTCR
jgi:hypothetical protein